MKERRSQPECNADFYHLSSTALKRTMSAIINQEQPVVDDAILAVKHLMRQLPKYRKPSNNALMSSWSFKQDMNEFTDQETYAELVFVEVSLMSIALDFKSNPNILTNKDWKQWTIRHTCKFVSKLPYTLKFGIKLFYVLYTFRGMGKLLSEKTNWKSERAKENCDATYKVGWDIYNKLLPELSSKVLKTLAILGFDQELGHKCLALSPINRQASQHVRQTSIIIPTPRTPANFFNFKFSISFSMPKISRILKRVMMSMKKSCHKSKRTKAD